MILQKSSPEKISKISDPFMILIERLYINTLCRYPKVEIRMILMTLIFHLIQVTLKMQHRFLDLRYSYNVIIASCVSAQGHQGHLNNLQFRSTWVLTEDNYIIIAATLVINLDS